MDCLHNLDAEKALLGAAINDEFVAQTVAAAPEAYFTDPMTQATHRAIKRLVAKGAAPDIVSLDAETACDFQDTAYLMALAEAGFCVSRAGQYETLLSEAAKRRSMISVAQNLLALAPDPSVDADALEASTMQTLQTVDTVTTTTSMHDAVLDLYDQMGKGSKDRVQTGIADLDRLTGGFAPSQLIYLAARPGIGKTAIGLYMANHIARNADVLLVSLEMDATEIAARALAAESKVDLEKMVTGRMEEADWIDAAKALPFVTENRLHITCRASTPLQVRREAVKLKARGDLRLIVIDYVQLMRSDSRANSRYEEITAISRDLKQLAMDLRIPILSMCQLNRQSERGFGKTRKIEPIMADARDSGALEQDANVFMILHEPEEPADQNTLDYQRFHACQDHGYTWQKLKVEKNRQGRTGVIDLVFDKPHMQYTCLHMEDT